MNLRSSSLFRNNKLSFSNLKVKGTGVAYNSAVVSTAVIFINNNIK